MGYQEMVEEGKDLVKKMQFDSAEQRFQQAYELNPQSTEILYWLGWLAFMANRRTDGFRYVEAALQINPRDARVLALKGMALAAAGEYQEAVKILEEAKASDPSVQMIYSTLARSYRETGKLDLAESAARRAIEMVPDDFLARCELSYIFGTTGRVKEGLQELAECMRINPMFLKPYMILGEIFRRGGQDENIVPLYQRGLAHNPKAFPLREQLCDLYASKSDFQSAYRDTVGLVTRRNYYGDYLRLGSYAVAIGAEDKAKKAFDKCRELVFLAGQSSNLDEMYKNSNVPSLPGNILGQVQALWSGEVQQ